MLSPTTLRHKNVYVTKHLTQPWNQKDSYKLAWLHGQWQTLVSAVQQYQMDSNSDKKIEFCTHYLALHNGRSMKLPNHSPPTSDKVMNA
jgi:hypothetical protein